MARTVLTVQSSGRITPLTNPTRNTPDASNGNSFDNSDQNVLLYITNGSIASIDVTIDIPGTFEGEARPNKVYAVAAGARKVIGPFSSDYNQTDNGNADQVLINWSASGSVTVELIACPNANDGI